MQSDNGRRRAAPRSTKARRVVLLLAMLAIPASTKPSAAVNTPAALVISGATLLDGTGRDALADSVIVIRDGKVAAVTAAGAAGVPGDARHIDARGKWIIPGLIDMHVHYHAGWMDDLFLRHGVTTVRDVGSGLDGILELRRLSREPGSTQPRLFACGPLIDGPWPRHGRGISVPVVTEDEARAVARRLLGRGVDCLKLYEQLTPPIVQAIVGEAERVRVPVTAHLRDTTALVAMAAGVRGLEHAFGFDACDEREADEVARRAADRAVYVVPTLTITEQVSRLRSPEIQSTPLLAAVPEGRRNYWAAAARGATPEGTARAARRLPCVKRFVGRLQSLGGRVVAGSDTSNPYVVPGASLQRELELLVESGLSPREALAAGTRTAAEFLGQGGTLGTIEAGKAADLVVLREDPWRSIGATRQIDLVIRDGRVLWPK